ncbi:hypothetical protein [Halpernia sp. GG3]
MRKVLYSLYEWNNCERNTYKSKLKAFKVLDNGDLLCLICGSLPTTKRLWKILNEGYLNKPGNTILDFSPLRCIFK